MNTILKRKHFLTGKTILANFLVVNIAINQ